MAKDNYDDKYSIASTDTVVPSIFNNAGDGLQLEFEERLDEWAQAGIISGLAASIDSADIDIASGRGYASGRRYLGAESITFSGSDAADDYYVYWDASVPALAKSTSAPTTGTAGDLIFCLVTWDGATTLSALTDLRQYGIERVLVSSWFCTDTVTTGIKMAVPIPYDCWINLVKIVMSDNGSASTTIVDVHAGSSGSTPTTIFTTTNLRPSVGSTTANYTVESSGVPDGTRRLNAGEVLRIDVDQVGTGAQNLGVIVYGTLAH